MVTKGLKFMQNCSFVFSISLVPLKFVPKQCGSNTDLYAIFKIAILIKLC